MNCSMDGRKKSIQKGMYLKKNERKMKSGGTPENWAAHRAPEPGRKFLPLGATSHRAQVSKGLVPQKPSPSAITGSFVSREPQSKPTPVLQLPDIYTTCPELRQFKPIMTLPDMTIHSPQPSLLAGESAPSSQHNKSSFDPNEAILKPYVAFRFSINFSLNFCF
ncbi:hypothetical protein TRFO_28108 [Tritrichomonas foetus]|uniref:Uncharacterized protein n=1 Tax=Tritrichomonas foetus TaxID=1144522 RepID=A0A1J4JYX3_9EUKA|nr:hypothetical protein TRFO_28108 [Tritrichomonas foetus]|eukprot:OHT04353.1 hypothetical protein TRFO_28108 [Tritrichomonas foetus]